MKQYAILTYITLFSVSSAPALAQCPSCEAPPALDCRINFDGVSVPLTTYKQLGCRTDIVASYGESKVNTCRRTFGPPFLLVDMALTDYSSNNGWRSASRYASGAKVDYKEQIEETYDQAIEIAGKYGDTAAEAKLKEMKKRHLDLSIQYSTNQDSIELKVEAAGHGWALDRKRGWQDSSIEVVVACIAPVNLLDQIKAHVGLKGDQFTLTNNSSASFYAHYGLQDDKTKSCPSATPAITVRVNARTSETIRLPINGKVCIRYYNKSPAKPSLTKSCEYTVGAVEKISALPTQCSN
ncbi:hypothetical protein [Ferribacterium limneticum]|uniref:hypothetical protein n=1 Tax=Ferribacterium limneticum TaxID=76259 RepID=UPI001CFB6B5B|nr:hypothetical protein [Ferribacterium limneticum]UCV18029.1 hypothetical protein KI610_14575 [Ferribacterium limneticum]